MSNLEQELEKDVRKLITRTLKETSYRPSYFMQMFDDLGAKGTFVALIRKSKPSDGFTKLWELGRLDLTIESLVLENGYASLFEDVDIRQARKRLLDYGYVAREGS